MLLLATDGSSFSPARGVARGPRRAVAIGQARSRQSWRCGRGRLGARAGSSGGGAGAAFGVVALGQLAGRRCDTRGAGSSRRGGRAGAGVPCGVPTAATAGPGSRRTSWAGAPTTCSPPRSDDGEQAVRDAPRAPMAVTGSGALRRAGPVERGRRRGVRSTDPRHSRQRSRVGSVTMPSRSIPARRTRSMVSTTAPYAGPRRP